MKIIISHNGTSESFAIDDKCTVSVLGNFIIFKDFCGKEVVAYLKDSIISIVA